MKTYKTLKFPLFTDKEIENKLFELRKIWVHLLETDLHSYCKFGYHGIKTLCSNIHSQHPMSAQYTSKQVLKSCIESCKVNCRTKFPVIKENTSIILTQNTIQLKVKENKLYAYVAYDLKQDCYHYNWIEIEINPTSDKYKQILITLLTQPKQLDGYRIRGYKILEKTNKWWLYVSIEHNVFFRKWNENESFIGVDVGMNNIAVVSVLDINDNKIKQPLFICGKEWKYLQLQKRNKISKLQRRARLGSGFVKGRSMDSNAVWNRYNERFSQILYITAKQIVEYAKQCSKPIIVLEDLGKFKLTKCKDFNYLLSNWARTKLQILIEHKANWDGIQVVKVYPQYTSIKCYRCGEIGIRNNDLFYCSKCDKQVNADFNASLNIASRFLWNIRHLLVTKGITTNYKSVVNVLPSTAHLPENIVAQNMSLMKIPESECNIIQVRRN